MRAAGGFRLETGGLWLCGSGVEGGGVFLWFELGANGG
ncbi:hypothetical protein SLEP1_g39345 [Rubroshorea leprosula]|uniref:Uncharacterized protein n=1 Tax=Rubroshorea leprosula TaxID=152421 RepID=A0AAV5L076_9ROSI|nr:hypothetical protein SLEP1_g39345 [Rubroshorea leprosula]